jgi:hypothetical protein
MLFSLSVALKRTRLSALKGNKKTYNSKIKSETKIPKIYFISPIVLFAGFFEGDAFSIFVR